MNQLELQSEYRKLAYLKVMGVIPLAASRVPVATGPQVRVLVRPLKGVELKVAGSSSAIEPRPSSASNEVQRVAATRGAEALSQARQALSADSSSRSRDGLPQPTRTPVNPLAESQSATVPEADLILRASSSDTVTSVTLNHAELPQTFTIALSCTEGVVGIALEETLSADQLSLVADIVTASESRRRGGAVPAPKTVEFHWPFAGLDKLSQTPGMAEQAFGAFLAKHVQQAPSLVLLFGEPAAAASDTFFRDRADVKTLQTYRLTQLLGSPDKKRELWRAVQARVSV